MVFIVVELIIVNFFGKIILVFILLVYIFLGNKFILGFDFIKESFLFIFLILIGVIEFFCFFVFYLIIKGFMKKIVKINIIFKNYC